MANRHLKEWFPPRGEFPDQVAALRQAVLTPARERRRSRRFRGLEECGVVSMRLRPGHNVAVLDLSSCGAFFETAKRLAPGAWAELRLETWRQRLTIRGSVIRCEVARLGSASVSYRAAVAFDGEICLVGAEALDCLLDARIC